ncbi:MAG TPA: DUF998 domain-containing protein [Pedococcus sp.]|nr:DUF998 domain-containing protein [Pedococcus sp.]
MAQPTLRTSPQHVPRRVRLGLACWLVQPFYVVVELLVAAGASAQYSLRDDTISALGQVGCSPGHYGSVVPMCSGSHVVLNAAFLVFGLLRAVGAILVRQLLDPTWWRAAAVTVWVVSGICSAAVGLAPVDRVPLLHSLAAGPVFLLQPFAVVATAIALRRTADGRVGVSTAGLVVFAATVVGTVSFGLGIGLSTWVGVLERLALWPAYVWLGLVAATLLTQLRVTDRRVD